MIARDTSTASGGNKIAYVKASRSHLIIFGINHHDTADRTVTGAAKFGAQNVKRTDSGRFKPKIGANSRYYIQFRTELGNLVVM